MAIETPVAAVETPVAVIKEEVPVVEAKAPVAETVETKPEAKVEEVKPDIAYELKLSEGSQLAQANVDEIVSYAKEHGLSNEAAQVLLAREEGLLSNFAENQKQQFEALRTDWYKSVETDKEIGGDNFKKSNELAQRALEKFAPDSLKKFLKDSPYGNHPDLIRTFYKIGKAMADDTLVSANAQGARTRSVEEILYDNTPKEN